MYMIAHPGMYICVHAHTYPKNKFSSYDIV